MRKLWPCVQTTHNKQTRGETSAAALHIKKCTFNYTTLTVRCQFPIYAMPRFNNMKSADDVLFSLSPVL